MSTKLLEVKKEMCEIGRRIWHKGFCAGNEGNHSVRIGDRILCTPTLVSKGFLTPDMICMVDLDGKQIDTRNKYKRTSEVLLHLAIYHKRPDVKAVIHSHPPHATAFAIAGIPLPEGIHPEAEFFLGKVPMAPYTTPGYAGLGAGCAERIGSDTNTVLLGNHGSVSFSTVGLMDAYYRLEILDSYCRLLMLARQLGQVRVMTPEEMVDLLKLKAGAGVPDGRLEPAARELIGKDNEAFLRTVAAEAVRPAKGTNGKACRR